MHQVRFGHLFMLLFLTQLTFRCPMEVRLQSATRWSCKVSLRFQYDSRGNPLLDVHEQDFGPTLYNKADVERTLRRAQRAEP